MPLIKDFDIILITWEKELNIPLIIIKEDIIKILYAGTEIPEKNKEKEEL